MRFGADLTRAAIDATRDLQVTALAQRPTGIGIILVIDGVPNLPSSGLRAYAAKMAAQYSEGVLAHATVMTGEGFTMSALRSALTGIFIMARSPYPRAVVGDVEAAMEFMGKHLKGAIPATGDVARIAKSLPPPWVIGA